MPVFESDEVISSEEFKRQQQQLNDKVFRLEARKMFDEESSMEENFNGGDCWESGNED